MRWKSVLVSLSFAGCFSDAPPVSDDDGSSGGDGSSAGDDDDDDGATSTPTTDPASTDPSADGDGSAGSDDDATSDPDTGNDTSDDGEDTTTGTTHEVVVLDFVEQACDAMWQNDEGQVLPCPGTASDMEGFVFTTDRQDVSFEDGSVVGDGGLVMHPRWAPGGLVQGRYTVDAQAGDVFRATIGCVQADSICSVELRLADADGQDYAPSPWSQTADGAGELVEVELPEPTTTLVLEVYAGEQSGSDATLWIEPQLVRQVAR